MDEQLLDDKFVYVDHDRFRKHAILIWLSLTFLSIVVKFVTLRRAPDPVIFVEVLVGSFFTGLIIGLIIAIPLAFIRKKDYSYNVKFMRVFWISACVFNSLLLITSAIAMVQSFK